MDRKTTSIPRIYVTTHVSWWHAALFTVVHALLLLSVSGCDSLLDLIDPPPATPQLPATPQPPAAPLPTLSIADADLVEEGLVAEFAVTLSAASEVPVTARYVTVDGSAHAGPANDYTHASGSVTFATGEQEQVITVQTLKDKVPEVEREVFTVRLSAAENATVGEHGVASGTILDSGDPRLHVIRIDPGPRPGQIETADDVHAFFVEVESSALVVAATDRGKSADPRSDYLDTVVRLDGGSGFSTNDGNMDAARVSLLAADAVRVYIRVSSDGPTPYDLFVWVLDEQDYPWIADGAVDPSFDIKLRYLGNEPTPTQKDVFRQAADVWERAITRGLPDRFIDSSEATCEDRDPSLFGTHVDDLMVYIRLKYIDGPGTTLAKAGACWQRLSHLPFIGTVTIDTADLANMERNGVLGKVVTHELAHALGFGIIWDQIPPEGTPFLQQPSVVRGSIVPGRDTHFSGPAAVAAFDAVGGDAYAGGAKVPVENDTDGYSSGALDGHWRESVLGHELLTSSLSTERGVPEPLSVVTIAALEDLGYSVDHAAAEQYTLPTTPPVTVRSASPVLHLLNDIRRRPARVEEPLDQSLDAILR